jgi:hypothetical protein
MAEPVAVRFLTPSSVLAKRVGVRGLGKAWLEADGLAVSGEALTARGRQLWLVSHAVQLAMYLAAFVLLAAGSLALALACAVVWAGAQGLRSYANRRIETRTVRLPWSSVKDGRLNGVVLSFDTAQGQVLFHGDGPASTEAFYALTNEALTSLHRRDPRLGA